MKHFFIILLAAAAVIFPRTASAVEWRTDLDAALKEAAERGAPVFLFLCQAT
jgi:hypothetical protein